MRSVTGLYPQNRAGEPMPWLTEPAVAFLDDRLGAGLTVGEFGSGNSTLWLASRCKQVVSVEEDAMWAERLRAKAPENVELIVPEGGGSVSLPADGYRVPAAFPTYAQSLPFDAVDFDLVFVDGLDRNGCVERCLDATPPVKTVVVDNTDGRYDAELEPTYRRFEDAGYRRVDFHGAALGSWRKTCTSVFYTDGNCLGL